MSQPRPDKVKTQEYKPVEKRVEEVAPNVESSEVKDLSAPPKPEESQSKVQEDSWTVGQKAPKTVYLDKASGKLSDTSPVNGKVIIFAGDQITPAIKEQLNK